MTDTRHIILFRIAKSEEMFQEAIMLSGVKHWNSVINRLYYAAYYASSALLLQHNIITKTHSGLKAKFNEHLIKTGMLSSTAGDIYNDLFSNRQDGDYSDFMIFSQEEAEPLINETRSLLDEINKLIK